MNAQTRLRHVRLESILATHAAMEQRTLADLRRAGFKFATVEQARRRLKAIRTLERMTSDEQTEVVLTALEKGTR